MRSLRIEAIGQPLVAVDTPEPSPGPGDVIVRVQAAGICRSDVHYRSGTRPVPALPLVPGHEIAGTVAAVGEGVVNRAVGERVSVHYLVTCGRCAACQQGAEQFCEVGEMIGLDRAGGFAEAVVVPARNAHPIPEGVSMRAAAVMMCSTATALHALRRASLSPGETVAVFGAGGLGMSAVQLARILGASRVLAVDVNPVKLAAAERLGATPVLGFGDVPLAIRSASDGGVDVALELVGDVSVMRNALSSLRRGGRAIAVGITDAEFGLDPFRDLVGSEVEIRGCSDHLSGEIDEVLAMAARGDINVDRLVTNSVRLDAGEVNAALDRLESFGDDIRTVIEN